MDFVMHPSRREFLVSAAATGAIAFSAGNPPAAETDLKPLFAEADRRHSEAIERLQHWIQQPSIAAENSGMNEGCELLIRMLRDAGFDTAVKVPTDGHPGVFGTLDAGAQRTIAI